MRWRHTTSLSRRFNARIASRGVWDPASHASLLRSVVPPSM
jgi:hypothetical protein